MVEYKNFIIPDDIYHLVLPYIKCNNIDNLSKEEFIKMYDNTINKLKIQIKENEKFYNEIRLGNTYPDKIYYLVLSYNLCKERVCEFSHQKFIKIFEKATEELRKDILSNEEYFKLLESNENIKF